MELPPPGIPVAFDLETHLITDTDKAPKPVVASIGWTTGDMWTGEETHTLLIPMWDTEPGLPNLNRLREILNNASEIVGANIAFDMGVLEQWYGWPVWHWFYLPGKVRDIQIAARLKDIAEGLPRQPISLKALAAKYAGLELDKSEDGWRTRYAELEGVPLEQWPPEARKYSRMDAAATIQVHNGLPPMVNEQEQTLAAYALQRISINGMAVERRMADHIKSYVEANVKEIRAELLGAGLYKYSGPKKDPTRKISRNTKLVQERVRAILGREAPPTDSGGVSTEADTLRMTGDPLLLRLVDLAGYEKLQSTYLPVLAHDSLHCGRWGIADSGRTTSAEPNLQNLPRESQVRDAIVARPGKVFAVADFPACELRCLAEVTERLGIGGALRDALRAGRDVPTELGALMEGVDYETLAARVKAGDERAKDVRQRAKAAIYGFPGGMGPRKMALTARRQSKGKLRLTEADARQLRQWWGQAFPELEQYLRWVGTLRGPGGFHRSISFGSGRVRSGMRYAAAANHHFQALAADIAKHALVLIETATRTPGDPLFGWKLVIFVHDEIGVEGPEEGGTAAATRLADLMETAGRKFAPSVPWPVEPVLTRRWSKKAHSEWDDDGNLSIWDEE